MPTSHVVAGKISRRILDEYTKGYEQGFESASGTYGSYFLMSQLEVEDIIAVMDRMYIDHEKHALTHGTLRRMNDYVRRMR
jgi:hypothetical protein